MSLAGDARIILHLIEDDADTESVMISAGLLRKLIAVVLAREPTDLAPVLTTEQTEGRKR